jgi:hypothetical protein
VTLVVLGLDPGAATGVATYNVTDGTFSSQIMVPLDACDYVERLASQHGPHFLCACERFTMMGGRKTAQADALEVIGTARWICHRHVCEFRLRGAADAARIGSTAELKKIGWHRSGPDHADKAAAQVLLAVAELLPSTYIALTGS